MKMHNTEILVQYKLNKTCCCIETQPSELVHDHQHS